jgi:hypothetical protein
MALHLYLPELPTASKGPCAEEVCKGLAVHLHRSGILDANAVARALGTKFDKRDVSDQPRVPRGQPRGGQWTSDRNLEPAEGRVVPVQEVVPWDTPMLEPWVRPLVRPVPVPPTWDSPPLELPNQQQRDWIGIPTNPYPDRPECAEEWADAYKFCSKLLLSGQLGKGAYRGSGQELGPMHEGPSL